MNSNASQRNQKVLSSSNLSINTRSKLEKNMSKKLRDSQNIFDAKDRPGPNEKKRNHAKSLLMKRHNDKNYGIMTNEKEYRKLPVTKDGLGLIGIDEYNQSLQKSEIDSVF